mmetsp:Transcript_11947/g.25228  ORF Transcript_11947/g.25228 Transcript_11947/m.25228 type:complete len:318 (-) Transcript_11947:177-1130(-)
MYDSLFFQLWFPVIILKDVVIPEMNANLDSTKSQQLTMSGFFVFLGCIFFMACFKGVSDRRKWWSSLPIHSFKGPPFCLNEYMPYLRFEDIMQALCLTNHPYPPYADCFHDARQIIDEFNEHYMTNYIPGWISCIDESMSVWLNKFCPRWMCVPRKPHPFGNEYHTICNGDLKIGTPIMFRVELVEGKDRPPQLGRKEFEEHGKTVGLMLRMSKNLWNTGKVVTMDSGLSVSKGILAMREKGVFGQALVKPRGRRWPVLVPGKYIDEYYQDKPIGYCKTLEQVVDGVKFFIHCQKEETFVTKIMSCHGVLTRVEDLS